MKNDEFELPRVLVFAPVGRDAPAAVEVLRRSNIRAEVCPDLDALIAALADDAGAVFVAEEGLFGRDLTPLAHQVANQLPWSDLPFLLLTSHQENPAIVAWRRDVASSLRNVALLERPVHPMTLSTAVRAALRARSQQFKVRDLLQARERAAQELERLVAERTSALTAANAQLRTEMAERTRVEAELRQAQKIEALGQLTGGVAHDFNNLLMVISGGLEMLDRTTDPDRRARLMDGMKQAAQRGASLTRQLLTFSRRQALKPEPVDLARRIGGMRELLDRSLRGDIHVELDFADALWPTEVDPGELELMVLNLAVNARDAMPNGGTITLRAENGPNIFDGELEGDFVLLSVRDTGVGMSSEVKEHVFEPFFTTKDVGRGSGLGLAQVYGFAKQSGGAVRIETEMGRGTVVTVLLPRSKAAPEPEELRSAGSSIAGRPAASAGSVLLVEDDDEVARMVSEMLRQLGYEITRSTSGREALKVLANGIAVDLVFSDIMMPGDINGVELAREVRRRRQELPVLLTSGYSEPSGSQASAMGIKILAKPFRFDDLAAALRDAVLVRQK